MHEMGNGMHEKMRLYLNVRIKLMTTDIVTSLRNNSEDSKVLDSFRLLRSITNRKGTQEIC